MQGCERAIYTQSVRTPQAHNTNKSKENDKAKTVEDNKEASSLG